VFPSQVDYHISKRTGASWTV